MKNYYRESLLELFPSERQRSLRDRGHTFISPAVKREVVKEFF